MSLNFPFQAPERDPSIPDHLAHEANDEASRAADVKASREAYEQEVIREVNHPAHKRLVEAQQNNSIVLYAFMTLVFVAVLMWEWGISQEMYAVLFSMSPIVPFVAFAGLAFIASAFLAEAIPLFAIISLKAEEKESASIQPTIERIYDRRRMRGALNSRVRYIVIGLVLMLAVEIFVYYISRDRIEYLREAGDLPKTVSQLQLFLPVFLFGIEVVLGIPTFAFVLWFYHWRKMARKQKKRTLLRDQELILQNSALANYTRYMQLFREYNRWASQHNRPELPIIPVGAALRALLLSESGYDAAPSHNTSASEPGPVHDKTSSTGEDSPLNDNGTASEQLSEQDHRIAELTNLVDEQRDVANRSI